MSKYIRLSLTILLASINNLLAQPLSGNYTINSAVATGGTNFQTLSDFADSINLNGISASVIAIVTPGSGPYTEQVVFDSIAGTGAGSQITLEGSGESITAITNTTDRHVIRLKSCKYFNINNFHIIRDTNSTGGFYGIHILNSGEYINISSCTIDVDGTTSTLAGSIVASGSETSILETGNFHNIQIFQNTTTGGGYGISLYGLLGNLAANIFIFENNIYDFHSNGIYLRETNGAVVRDNHMDKRTENVTSVNYIQIAQAANINSQIYNNFISVSQTSNGTQGIRGIYLFDGTGHKVFNNVIHNVKLKSGNFTAIEVRTEATAPEISFNTITIDDTSSNPGELYGIKEELSNTNSVLRNNIISITQPGTGKSTIVLGSLSTLSTALNSNYNDLYIANGGYLVTKNSATPVVYPTIVNWRAVSTQDLNSISVDPFFTTPSTPVPTNLTLDNAGISLPGITTDVLGNLRGASPDIGAYEFGGVSISSIENNENIICFPNPATNELFVKINLLKNNPVSYSIFTLTGKEILSNEINISDNVFSVDTKNLSNGIYFLTVRNNDKSFNSKFVKQ